VRGQTDTPERSLLEIEELLTADQRRTVTPEDHLRFRETISKPRKFDEIDESMADPMIDRAPRRSDAYRKRLESILDEIGEEVR
jgi:hypothetical protein